MVEQSTNNILENVYKFNAKELDSSTGYYYYGARYYDPGASIFLSVDPLYEQFPAWNPFYNASFVYKNGDGTIVTGASFCPPGVKCAESFSAILNNRKSVKAPKSPEATIIHEIAHPIYENGNQRDVLKEENLVRDILKIERRSAADPSH